MSFLLKVQQQKEHYIWKAVELIEWSPCSNEVLFLLKLTVQPHLLWQKKKKMGKKKKRYELNMVSLISTNYANETYLVAVCF